jgi:hypothetical protein
MTALAPSSLGCVQSASQIRGNLARRIFRGALISILDFAATETLAEALIFDNICT